MAGHALNGERFVFKKARFVRFQRLVAGGAGHFLVPSAQGESTVSFVIEFFGKPVDGYVTAGTIEGGFIGQDNFLELIPMRIGMAVNTFHFFYFFILSAMTGSTAHPIVGSSQFELCSVVIKCPGKPTVLVVTGHTTPAAILFGHTPLVWIQVTGNTGFMG